MKKVIRTTVTVQGTRLKVCGCDADKAVWDGQRFLGFLAKQRNGKTWAAWHSASSIKGCPTRQEAIEFLIKNPAQRMARKEV